MTGYLAAVVVGYLLGTVNPATLIARYRGVDLRAVGSGNPGASNAGRALGRVGGTLLSQQRGGSFRVPPALPRRPDEFALLRA